MYILCFILLKTCLLFDHIYKQKITFYVHWINNVSHKSQTHNLLKYTVISRLKEFSVFLSDNSFPHV